MRNEQEGVTCQVAAKPWVSPNCAVLSLSRTAGVALPGSDNQATSAPTPGCGGFGGGNQGNCVS